MAADQKKIMRVGMRNHFAPANDQDRARLDGDPGQSRLSRCHRSIWTNRWQIYTPFLAWFRHLHQYATTTRPPQLTCALHHGCCAFRCFDSQNESTLDDHRLSNIYTAKSSCNCNPALNIDDILLIRLAIRQCAIRRQQRINETIRTNDLKPFAFKFMDNGPEQAIVAERHPRRSRQNPE